MPTTIWNTLAVGTTRRGYFSLTQIIDGCDNGDDRRYPAVIDGCPFDEVRPYLWEREKIPLIIIVNQKGFDQYVMARACIWLANTLSEHRGDPLVMFQASLETNNLRKIFSALGISVVGGHAREIMRQHWGSLTLASD